MCPIAASKKEMVTLWQISIFCPFYSNFPKINALRKVRENKMVIAQCHKKPLQFHEFFDFFFAKKMTFASV